MSLLNKHEREAPVGKIPEADLFRLALRARISRFALFPASPSVLQATEVPSQVLGRGEQVIGIKKIKEIECALQSIFVREPVKLN